MSTLPPGQREIPDFPRFGLTPYASRFPKRVDSIHIEVSGLVESMVTITNNINQLERVSQVSDFHCVTTWSKTNLRWSGVRFADVFQHIIAPVAKPEKRARLVVFRSQDGYRTALPLDDLLAPDVLLADQLDNRPLSVAHGGPIRLIAPAHYGYKSVKYLKAIEFQAPDYNYRRSSFRFMDHPRARVELEERGTTFPGRILRLLYRPLINTTRKTFARELERYQSRDNH